MDFQRSVVIIFYNQKEDALYLWRALHPLPAMKSGWPELNCSGNFRFFFETPALIHISDNYHYLREDLGRIKKWIQLLFQIF